MGRKRNRFEKITVINCENKHFIKIKWVLKVCKIIMSFFIWYAYLHKCKFRLLNILGKEQKLDKIENPNFLQLLLLWRIKPLIFVFGFFLCCHVQSQTSSKLIQLTSIVSRAWCILFLWVVDFRRHTQNYSPETRNMNMNESLEPSINKNTVTTIFMMKEHVTHYNNVAHSCGFNSFGTHKESIRHRGIE